jgi:hypothetical protein
MAPLYALGFSHDHDRDHGHDSICHGCPHIWLSGLDEFPSACRVSSHCIHGRRAYPPDGARGSVAVLTVRGVADLGAVLHAACDYPEGFRRHKRVRSGSSENPPVKSWQLMKSIFTLCIPPLCGRSAIAIPKRKCLISLDTRNVEAELRKDIPCEKSFTSQYGDSTHR